METAVLLSSCWRTNWLITLPGFESYWVFWLYTPLLNQVPLWFSNFSVYTTLRGFRALLVIIAPDVWTNLKGPFWLSWTGYGSTIVAHAFYFGGRRSMENAHHAWTLISLALPKCKVSRMAWGLCLKGGVQRATSQACRINVRISRIGFYPLEPICFSSLHLSSKKLNKDQ